MHIIIGQLEYVAKVQPRTGDESQDLGQRLSSTLSFTSALHGNWCLTPPPDCFTLGERDQVPIV